MHWIWRIIMAILVNLLALLAAVYFVPGFSITGDYVSYLKIAAVLTILNFFLKPILKLILGPIIIITLGLGMILVNAIILYALDFLSRDLSISGVIAMFSGAIIVSVINFIFHFTTK